MSRDTYEVTELRPSFLISPVRGISLDEHDLIKQFVAKLTFQGWEVHWPLYHTRQEDSIGLRICSDNLAAIAKAERVFVWWSDTSQGSIFDLGMAFALGKPIELLNQAFVKPTEGKSFQNVLLALSQTQSAAAGGQR